MGQHGLKCWFKPGGWKWLLALCRGWTPAGNHHRAADSFPQLDGGENQKGKVRNLMG